MLNKFLNIYKPAPHIERFPEDEIPKQYSRYRWQMMISIFVGYASYYLVRQNFSLAKPYLIKNFGYTTGDVGLIATALTISYGLSKFIMGNVSDRSNPRYFMATGLILSGIINLFFGFLYSIPLMFIFWFLNGWFQGMGWPPGGRTMAHWFSDRERGTKFAIWNTAHNVGGAIVGPIVTLFIFLFLKYNNILFLVPANKTSLVESQIIFYIPGIISIVIGILVAVFLRDTPQSVGLPSIEEFKNDYPKTGVEDREKELSGKEILYNFVFNNKYLWYLAIANIFVYIVRYGIVNWATTYLTMVKHCPGDISRWQVFVFEIAAIPGILLSGWVSDRFFQGRRSPISVIFMILTSAAVVVYWLNPPGHYLIDSIALFAIGFLIYGPVMMIGIAAVDLVPKKAAGTAAGFTGLFGYLFGATLAESGIGKIVQYYNWNGGFTFLIISAVLATVFLALTWNVHNRAEN